MWRMTNLRIASYNIRKCVGLDWKRDPQRVLAVIQETQADIIALQEIDKRFGSRDRTLDPETIAEQTDYKLIGAPVRPQSSGFYGNAILISKDMSAGNLQTLALPSFEPRGALMADIQLPPLNGQATQIRIIATHLAIVGRWRRQQIRDIFDKFVKSSPSAITIIAGDFNEIRAQKGFYNKTITKPFDIITPGASFQASKPIFTLDKFIIAGDGYQIGQSGVLHTPLSKKASDHLPIWVDLDLSGSCKA